jgi:CheY-like chemotaxis protein
MQVIANLLSNAIKFSPREAEVVVAIEERGERVRMTVRDHGPGIPETFRTRIFEKFAQADGSDARRKGGTGLGLSIVKEIVLRLGGEVGFYDTPGGGTTFHVELPCLVSQGSGDVARGEEISGLPSLHQNDAGAAAVMRDDLSAALDGRTRLRVLHLDDDPDVLGIVAHSLDAEAIVVSVATIEQARLALAATHFDLAVVDLALGGSSGFDLLPALRNSKGEAIPVIIYSALAADPACPPQVQAVLTKSRASIDTLIATLRKRIAAGAPQAEREPA